MKMTLPESAKIRVHKFPECLNKPFWLFENDFLLKSHLQYKSAKAGDAESAVELIADLALDFLVEISINFSKNLIFVAPHAREATGDNAIPQVLAAACAMVMQGRVDTDIVQVTRVFHTGADPMERMSLRAEFDGEIIRGAHYVLVDDVTNMGGTLAELANFILDGGGNLSAAIVLVNAGRNKQFNPSSTIIEMLEKRYGNEIKEIFGIAANALTANEANYLIGFRSTDEIRNRLVKARKETGLRLCSKGIEQQGKGSIASSQD